ncbi:Cytochrome P450 monooxygenase 74 [Psilocybe cubensis]|uniref:Cytochrome P450 monooxygenase 74 n=1 Tax=Psilocybe cubensis TaxID=181762 RepID=A0ACB8H2M9_PSICU|nr:Cytochrome P450 monooxygenase 74 [Psilocybe cubensis]KAH9481980.1 Cytochrome P450 monooxygenase 74 [Psilocybe cubensis]
MSLYTIPHLWGALALAAAIASAIMKFSRRSSAKQPPGPRDIVYYKGLGNSILVLNSLESMQDLLVKKGNVYCSRPYFVVASELMDLVNSTAFTPFGPRWRLHRKFARAALSPSAVKSYESTLAEVASRLNASFLENPDDFCDHVRLAAGGVIMGTIYGITVRSAEDPYIKIAESAMNIISKAVIPGAFIVDLVPALKYLPAWIPFATFHQVGRRGRTMVAELICKPFEYVKSEIPKQEAGTAQPSFTADVLTHEELKMEWGNDAEYEEALKWASASMYAVLNMIMAMATNPEKLKLAQGELDRIVGPNRKPNIKDRDNLPYIHAIIKETLRWHPPLPMDIARSSIDDDYYRGFFIPKNTTVIPNVWAIAHAPNKIYPPETFAPERFLEDNPALDPSAYCFGFGRRYLAMSIKSMPTDCI